MGWGPIDWSFVRELEKQLAEDKEEEKNHKKAENNSRKSWVFALRFLTKLLTTSAIFKARYGATSCH